MKLKTDCEDCARALKRLMASRAKPGPAVGQTGTCPYCKDRRFFVVFEYAHGKRHSVNDEGVCPHWCEACHAEANERAAAETK